MHSHICRNAKTKDFGIDGNCVTKYCTRIFQLVDTLSYTGAGHANLVCDVPDRHAAILIQCRDNFSISCVEAPSYITASIHRFALSWITPAGP